MKRIIAIVLALVMVLSTAAVVAADDEKVFRFAATTEPNSLDPSMGNSIGENEIQYAITEGLVRNIAGTVQPGLAESWESDETGLVWTFHLRDCFWSDGVQIKAQDFEYALKRLANPETGSGYAWILSFIKNADDVMYNGLALDEMGVKALDDKTLQIELAYVAPYFLSLIGSSGQFAPIRQDLVEKYGHDFAATADKNVYSGPYKLVSTEDLTIVFERNEYYWNQEAVHFDRAEEYIVADGNTQLAMYENEELDYVLIPTAQVINYIGAEEDNEFVNGNTDWMYINCGEESPLCNKNLRLALNYAISRNAYNMLANSGTYQPFNGVVCNIVAGLDGKYFSEMYPENRIFPMDGDQDKAQEYLKAYMDEMGYTDPSQVVLELTSTDAESTKKICEVVQNLLQTSLGITINIRQVTYNEIYSTVFPQHDYQFGYGGWGPDYDDPYTYLELFYGPNPNNYSNYKNAEVDALLEQAKKDPDQVARMNALGKAEEIILSEGALLPLQMRTAHYLIDEDLTDIHFYYGSVNLIWCYGDVK